MKNLFKLCHATPDLYRPFDTAVIAIFLDIQRVLGEDSVFSETKTHATKLANIATKQYQTSA
jgi:hypothetical protein